MKRIFKFLLFSIVVLFSASMFSQVLIIEDFDSSLSFPDGWSSPTLPDFIVTSNNACQINSVRGPLNTNSTNPELVYMSQNATGEAIEISFDYKILNATNSAPADQEFGSFQLQYSIDDGKNWTTYHTINSSNHAPSTLCTRVSHTISGSNIPANSKFGWRLKGYHNKGSSYIFIDNFEAIEDVDCKQPFKVIIEEVSFESISISWTELNNPSATQWEIAYCPKGIKPNNPVCFLNNMITVASNPYKITGLDEATEYDIYVRAVCSSNSKSAWSAPIGVQTLALGADCSSPIEIVNLPYKVSSDTRIYGNNYEGSPGSGCFTAGDFLNGYDVVYKYSSAKEDILQIELSGDLAESVGVFVYESCSDIGTECYTGAFTTEGKDFSIKDLNVQAGKDYYIVISTLEKNTTTKYTLNITGFDCASWEAPSGNSSYEFFNQSLADYSGTRIGVNPTMKNATLAWFNDATLNSEITDLSAVSLSDNDEFWVVQKIMDCISPAHHVIFKEYKCEDLNVIESYALFEVCDQGSVALEAKAGTKDLIWYDQPINGNPIGIGSVFNTPELTETTSFWVSEFFKGEDIIKHQANPGPVSSDNATTDAGLTFELFEAIVIKEVEVFIVGPSGDLTIDLVDSKGGLQQRTINVPGGHHASPTPVTLKLDFEISDVTTGPFHLVKSTGPAMLITPAMESSFPYPIASSGQVTASTTDAGISKSNDYYYFYNWTVLSMVSLCESERVEVQAVVNKTLDITIDAKSNTTCIGQVAELSVISEDKNYEYTWRWVDENGVTQTQKGAAISPVINQKTSFRVSAINPNTGCSTSGTISIDVEGVNQVLVNPISKTICSGEVLMLRAGEIKHTFEEEITDWTLRNNSVPAQGVDAAQAGWKRVSSPYSLADHATSNDASSFMISIADNLGPGSSVNTEMISPPFSLVGLTKATLEFHHFYKHLTTKRTNARVLVSDNAGRSWKEVDSYSETRGQATKFEKITIDLNEFLGSSDVRIKFEYTGLWGWWWAIDNVTINQTYGGARLIWSGDNENTLFIDENATIEYKGQHTDKIYFKSDEAGVFDFHVGLNISSCNSSITNKVTVKVNKPEKPIGATKQELIAGSKISDLVVQGTNLRHYVKKEGVYIHQTINTELKDGETYYVSQKIEDCTSDYLEIYVTFLCPPPSELHLRVNLEEDGTSASTIIFWEHPEALSSNYFYNVLIKDAKGEIIKDEKVNARYNYFIATGLPLEETFTVELSTICDEAKEVYSDSISQEFDTKLLSTPSFETIRLTSYPNPVDEVLNIYSPIKLDKIELYTKEGRHVLTHDNIHSKEVQLNVSRLSTGTYLLIASIEEQFKVLQIIKK